MSATQGPNAAVGDHGRKIQLLLEDYKKIAEEVTNLGFKGEMFNLEIEVAKPQQQLNNEEKLLEKIMEDNAMTSTGRLFKLGVQVANAAAVTKAGRKKVELMETKRAELIKTKTKREIAVKREAIDAFKKFLTAGKPSKLPAKDSKAILKFVLPLLAPNEKLAEYNTGPKAIQRLVKFGIASDNKLTWISEMEKHLDSGKKLQEDEEQEV